jgi:hypothetical protein
VSDGGQVVLTPTVSRLLRRSLFWIVIATIIVLISVVAVSISNTAKSVDLISATNAGPNGAKAIVEVLRHEGVTVTVTGTLQATRDAVRDPDRTTIFLYDPNFFLSVEQIRDTYGLASTVVVLDPTYVMLDEISPDLAPAGYVSGTLTANCEVDAAVAAEEITGRGSGFRVIGDATDVDACFGSGDDIYSLLHTRSGSTTFTVLGATDALTNGVILENGNAALGLNLLGESADLIWYMPTLDDLAGDMPTAGELSPPWVLPVTLLFFLALITAAFWRGRRLGPLIIENLPVTVRASETMNGRARLYEKANARQHTLDSLRIGTIARLAKATGLPVLSTVDEVIASAAAVAAMDPNEVRRILIDGHPESDRSLVHLSDELLQLEQRVALNSRPH